MKNETLPLETLPPMALAVDRPQPMAMQTPMPSPLSILEKAITGGVTAENVAVVKELMQMCREQKAEDSKAAFAKAFFQLRKNMPEIYADKQSKTKSGDVAFTYCSESEISKMLEPHLMSYGFAMLFGQSEHEGRITVNVTLMHETGHSEIREYTVRSGQANAMKDAAMCDAGGATTAWRHLMIKMFGLKSRISDNADARLEGSQITAAQAESLRSRVAATGSDEAAFLKLAGAPTFEAILSGKYPTLDNALRSKEKATPPTATAAAAPTKESLKTKLWETLAPVRGTANSWDVALVWLRSKNIVADGVKVGQLEIAALEDVIEKSKICLAETQ